MKKIIVAFTIAILTGPAYLFAGPIEEYAIITTYQQGKKNFVNIAIGSNNQNIEVPAGSYDLSPLVNEMEKLNKKGYRLVNGSNAVVPFGVNLAGGFPVFMLVFVKESE